MFSTDLALVRFITRLKGQSMSPIATPARGITTPPPTEAATEPIGPIIPFGPAMFTTGLAAQPDEGGVPTCAEDAAEEILRRPRDRSIYARTVNPVLQVAALSPHRSLNVATWVAVSALVLLALTVLASDH